MDICVEGRLGVGIQILIGNSLQYRRRGDRAVAFLEASYTIVRLLQTFENKELATLET